MVLDDTTNQSLDRAMVRAYARDLSVKLVETKQFGVNGSEFFDVASFSTGGLQHRVRLDFTSEGITGYCDCVAGQHGKLCQHIAAALEPSTALSQPEPVVPKLNILMALQAEGDAIRRELYG